MSSFWPFLYAANRSLDYRAVVAPEFLVNRERVEFLIRNIDTEVENGASDKTKVAHLDDPTIGRLTVFYRPHFVAKDGETVLDRHGRQIVRVDGIVFRDAVMPDRLRHGTIEELFGQVNGYLEKNFDEFWGATKGFPTVSSPNFNSYEYKSVVKEVQHADVSKDARTELETESPAFGAQLGLKLGYFFVGVVAVLVVEIVIWGAYDLMSTPEPSLQMVLDESKKAQAMLAELPGRADFQEVLVQVAELKAILEDSKFEVQLTQMEHAVKELQLRMVPHEELLEAMKDVQEEIFQIRKMIQERKSASD